MFTTTNNRVSPMTVELPDAARRRIAGQPCKFDEEARATWHLLHEELPGLDEFGTGASLYHIADLDHAYLLGMHEISAGRQATVLHRATDDGRTTYAVLAE